MLETLMNLVRQQSGDAIINNPAIPNEHNNTAMEAVTSGIFGGLQQQAQGGGIGNLLGMVMGQGGNVQDSPVTAGVQQNVQQSLMEKLGISPAVAMSIAGSLVPMVLGKLMHKAQDPNDSSVDQNGLMNMIAGQQGGGGMDWMGAASSAMADGKLDMNDLMRIGGGLMGGGGGGQQQSGGLGGMLGGLFGGK